MASVTETITSASVGYDVGQSDLFANVWTDFPLPDTAVLVSERVGARLGWRLPSRNDGSTARSSFGGVVATAASLRCELALDNGGVGGTLQLWQMVRADPPAFSNAFRPGTWWNVRLVGEVTSGGTDTDGTQYTFTFDDLDYGALSGATRNSAFNDFTVWELRALTTEPLGIRINTTVGFQFQWTYDDVFDTGRSTGKWRTAVSRMDRCPRCGWMSLREEWIREVAEAGQSVGRLICKRCWDEPDQPRRILGPEVPLVNES